MRRVLDLIRSRTTAFTHDLLMIPVAWFGAYWLRFNLEIPPAIFLARALEALGIVLVCQGAVNLYFGLYRGIWRYASLPDLARILQAVAAGTVLSAAGVFFLTRMDGVPRSVFPLYAVLLTGLLAGPRLFYRLWKDHGFRPRQGRRVLVVGAGRAGEMLVRDLLRAVPATHEPVAFVDDDPAKLGKEVHGIPVVATCDAIPWAVTEYDAESILIATPSALSAQMRRIVGECEASGVPFRTLPRMQDLVSGQVSVREIREVRIEDLLGREKVTLDWEAISRGLAKKNILVTGGGGSIGSELCRQIARLEPAKLIIYERSEFNLYKIDLELRRTYPALELVSVLGDVCDLAALEDVMRVHRPAAVFHVAAYKHVPLLEQQTRQAVLNNIIGTRNAADLADKYECGSFVLISTDKAVNPANIMGTTKRVAEIYCQHKSKQSTTHYITVRFGNVFGSDGSVIPLFQDQIARGGPVTVTHREISRYFMTIPEASQLILQACVMGRGGEIFVLDMGEPIRISYLAEQLIRLSGKQPGSDIEIVYTGLRPGEKLYEELFHHAEKLADTTHPKILLAQSRQVGAKELGEAMAGLMQACAALDDTAMVRHLDRLVPEQMKNMNEPAERAAWPN